MKSRMILAFALGCAMLFMFSAYCAAEEQVVKDQVRCYTTFDDFYLYVGISVDCPDIRATHTAPNADVTGDDCITIFVDGNANRLDKINKSCFSMTVSPAGGAQFRAGNDSGAFEPAAIWTFKYGNNVQGTLNNGDDIDQGYSVEMAIPWNVMNIEKLAPGDAMGFNFVIRRHGDKPNDFVSLSPEVKTEQDLLIPAKWSKIIFANYSFGVATTNWDKLLSARYTARAPLINGVISDKEWHKNTSYAIDMPVPEGFVYEAKFPVQPLIIARYDYNYQADKRKAAPISGITKPDGTPALIDFPIKNVGPWMSYDRVEWHKEQLSEMVATGIDVVAPVYAAGAEYADKGLDCLVSALEELRAEGNPYPKITVILDAASMNTYFPEKDSATREKIIDTLYGFIKSFYDRVPADFRAQAQSGKPDAGRCGAVVFLSANGYTPLLDLLEHNDVAIATLNKCSDNFKKDFGCPLVWKTIQTSYEGNHIMPISCTSAGCEGNNINLWAVGPCFDCTIKDSGIPHFDFSSANRLNYDQAWSKTIERTPNWILCDSWNNFCSANDLCATRQYDGKYLDATLANVKRFQGNKDFDAQYLRVEVPQIIAPKQIALASFEIKNIGNSPWRASEGYALAYRWYKTGRYYGESKVRVPIAHDVMPGETAMVDVGIATVNAQGGEIAEGSWELRFELIRNSDGKWFSNLGDQPFLVPVTIGQPQDWATTWLNCKGPVMLAPNQDYPMTIRVRNDGSQLWSKGIVKLGGKLYKVQNDGASEGVQIKDIQCALAKDCKPGEIAEFAFDLNLKGANKQSITASRQGEPWSYQLRFDLYNGKNWLAESGVRTLNRMIDIYDNDYGPKIVDCDIPETITAGQSIDAKVVVRNNGTQTWDRKRTKIGYHWYHIDGTEMLWDGNVTPIKQNIQPGWPIVITAPVKAPAYDGQYVLVWDVMIDDQWLSTGPLSRGGDILPVMVEVTGGKFAFVDLSKLCDVQLSSPDTDRTAGDFDGKGSSFPSELMPPDAGLTKDVKRIYPTGYNWIREDQPEGRVSFLYPDKTPGTPGAVACNSQAIQFPQGSYKSLHILAASTNDTASGEISLDYTKGTQVATVPFSDWSKGPSNGEKIAFASRHRHSHGGDEIGKMCYLYDYTIQLDSSSTLTGIILPKNSDIKMVAVTLEKTEALDKPAADITEAPKKAK